MPQEQPSLSVGFTAIHGFHDVGACRVDSAMHLIDPVISWVAWAPYLRMTCRLFRADAIRSAV
jgi:hypothetical protein